MNGRSRCDTCTNARFHEDRHGFDFGPAEVSFECIVFDGLGSGPDREREQLTARERDALDSQELGVTVDCPQWASKSDDLEHYAFLFGGE